MATSDSDDELTTHLYDDKAEYVDDEFLVGPGGYDY